MNISVGISIAVCLIGLVLYLVAAAPKPQEIGRIMFAMGLLATLMRFAGEASLRLG